MVLLLVNSPQRVLHVAALQPPTHPSQYLALAQRAEQQQYEATLLPEAALPIGVELPQGPYQQGAELLQPRSSWGHLPTLTRLEDAPRYSSLADQLQGAVQPRCLQVQALQAAGLPDILLRGYKTPAIDAWAASNQGRLVLEVPLLPPEQTQPQQEAPLHKQLMQVLRLEAAAEIPCLPEPAYQVPDLMPQQKEVAPAAAAKPAWSFVDHMMEQGAVHPSRSTKQSTLFLDVPLCSWTTAWDESDSLAMRQQLQSELGSVQLEGKSSADMQQAVPDLRSIAGATCVLALRLHPSPLQLAPAPMQSKLPEFMEAACCPPPSTAQPSVPPGLFDLEMPLLLGSLASGAAAGVGACPPELLVPFDLPELPEREDWQPGAWGQPVVSLAMLIAQEMVLEDDTYMLPPVVFDSEDASSADSRPSARLSHQLQAECGIKPVSTAHLALYLDWSLSSTNASLRPPELVAASKKLSQSLWPSKLPTSADTPAQRTAAAAAVLTQLLSSYQPSKSHLQERPAEKLQLGNGKPQMRPGLPRQALPQRVAARLPAGTGGAGAGEQEQEARQAPPPAAHASKAKPAAGGHASARDDMKYFLQLQQGAACPAGRQHAAGPSAEGAGQSSDSAADSIGEFLGSASCAVTQVPLPGSHMQLLRLLREDEQRLVKATPGLPAAVAGSDFLYVDALENALHAAAGNASHPRELMRAYAVMAVIRQTALSLVHHGVRCAHLYLSQSAPELPGLLSGVTAMRELQQAFQQVESNKMEDHPKQEALRRVLAGISALSTGSSNVMVIADRKSFFTLYQCIMAAGFRVCQFDRDELLLREGAAPAAVEAALQQALSTANCVLVSVQQASSGQLPTHAFQHIVQYASEPEALAGLQPFLASCKCPQHIVQVLVGDLSGGPEAVAGGPSAAAAPLQLAGATAGAAKGGQPVQDWPVVVSSDAGRPIRQHRALYEALLQLEREGASVVERPLSLIDVVLSPSAALIIFDNTSRSMEFAAFLGEIQPVLERVSYAFAKIILICHGSHAFQAQVLSYLGQLLAVGQSYGLQLQCFTSTSIATTQALVKSIGAGFLAQWASMDAQLQYSILDDPKPMELFLSRFPSVNPHSAALLASLGASLQQILHLDLSAQERLPPALALLPRHSLELLVACAEHGTPVLGAGMGGHEELGQQGASFADAYAITDGRMAPEPSDQDGYLSPTPQGMVQAQRQSYGDPSCSLQYPGASKRQRRAAAGFDSYLHQPASHQPSAYGTMDMQQQEQLLHQAAMQQGRQPQHAYAGHMQQQELQLAHMMGTGMQGGGELVGGMHFTQQQQRQQQQFPSSLGGIGTSEHQSMVQPPPAYYPTQQWQQQQQQAGGHLQGSDMLGAHLYHGQAAGQHMQGGMPHAANNISMGVGAGAQARQPPYLSAQLWRQQAAQWDQQAEPQWDPRFEPQVAMNDMVYSRSMQVMAGRMRRGGNPPPGGAAHAVAPACDDLPDIDLDLDGDQLSGPNDGFAGLHPAFGDLAGRQHPGSGWPSQQQLLPVKVPLLQQAAGGQGLMLQGQLQRHPHHASQAGPAAAFPGYQQQAPMLEAQFTQHAHRPSPLQQPGGWPHAWAPTAQQAQYRGHVDEFGVSLDPSLSDEESDHDATLSTRLSPLGLQPAHMGVGGQSAGGAVSDPIAALVGSRRGGFAPPRLTPPGRSVQRPGEGSQAYSMEEGAADGQPPSKRTFTRRVPGQAAGQPAAKKYGGGWRGGAKRGGGRGGYKRGGSFSRR